MTREEFIQVLDEKGYSYGIKGEKIIITQSGGVDLGSLETLPSGVEFKNEGHVDLSLLKTLPPGVEFKNGESVYLGSLETLPLGVVFKNRGSVDLGGLKSLPSGMEFKNGGDVYLGSVRDWVHDWDGNIEGVDSNRLLNLMISKGLFER